MHSKAAMPDQLPRCKATLVCIAVKGHFHFQPYSEVFFSQRIKASERRNTACHLNLWTQKRRRDGIPEFTVILSVPLRKMGYS